MAIGHWPCPVKPACRQWGLYFAPGRKTGHVSRHFVCGETCLRPLVIYPGASSSASSTSLILIPTPPHSLPPPPPLSFTLLLELLHLLFLIHFILLLHTRISAIISHIEKHKQSYNSSSSRRHTSVSSQEGYTYNIVHVTTTWKKCRALQAVLEDFNAKFMHSVDIFLCKINAKMSQIQLFL